MKKAISRSIKENFFKELNKPILQKTLSAVILIIIIMIVSTLFWYWGYGVGQTATWDLISFTENNLLDVYSNNTQQNLQGWLPNGYMNFTDGLLWESDLLEYTQNRPKYEDVIQVLNSGKGACGEFVWVFAAFCVANDIPVRLLTVGYFSPNVVDHSWAQVNPSKDGKTWIHVEVTDTCVSLQNGKTIADLWNVTINNNAYYVNRYYKMVLAYEMNHYGEIVITDVTATFSQS